MSEEESEVDVSEEVDVEDSIESLPKKLATRNEEQNCAASADPTSTIKSALAAPIIAQPIITLNNVPSIMSAGESNYSSQGSSRSTPNANDTNAAANALMTFDGGGISDDEVNSWEDDLSESEESGDNYYDEEEDEESPIKKESSRPDEDAEAGVEEKDDPAGRLVMNVHCTEYDIIKKVARKNLNFKLRHYNEDHEGAIRRGQHNQKLVKEWDVTWHDLSITPDFLAKLNPYQKVNHYPGMYSITRKNHLARNLMRMKRAFPAEYDFFPATWVLPGDNIDFRNQFGVVKDGLVSKKGQTYIVKPDGLSQGKGIFLSRRVEKILNTIETAKEEEGIGGWVVQHYLDQPHLIDDLKYDLRIYVLVNCVNPLRIYVHQEGLARFCTEPYRRPTARNMDNLYMHLTNYAINKFSDAYAQADEESDDEESGHKRSLKAIMKILECCGADSEKLDRQIKDIIVKTVTASQPYLAHLYRSCQPEDLDGSMCFQILGFDIMIDQQFKPWLIEVNQSPSFATDSPLDYKTKKAVLNDTFSMLNCSVKKRKQILKHQRAQLESRILTGKQARLEPEEKARLKEEKLKERFKFEEKRCGQWELILPWPEEPRNSQINEFIKKAQEIWDEFTTGKGKRFQHGGEDKRGGSLMGKGHSQATSMKQMPQAKTALQSNTGSAVNLRSTKPNFNKASNVIREQLRSKCEYVSAKADDASASYNNQARATQMYQPAKVNIGNLDTVTIGRDHSSLSSTIITGNHGQVSALKRFPAGSSLRVTNVSNLSGQQSKQAATMMSGSYNKQQRSLHNLEVIEQQSREALALNMAARTQSDLNLVDDNQSDSVQISANSPSQQQRQAAQSHLQYKMNKIGNTKRAQQDFVLDHLKMLTQPGNHNQAPVTNIKHEQKKLEHTTNMFLQRMEESRREIKLNENPSMLSSKQEGDLQQSDSKQSFMQRQFHDHQRHQELQKKQKKPVRLLNGKMAAADSKIEAAMNSKSPGSKTGSCSDDRQSLKIAGNEQINFMIASNYTNFEHMKQQQGINIQHDQQVNSSHAQNHQQNDKLQSNIGQKSAAFRSVSPWIQSPPQPSQLQSKLGAVQVKEVFESVQQLDSAKGSIPEMMTFTEKMRKSHALTEQKKQNHNRHVYQHTVAQEETFADRSNHNSTGKAIENGDLDEIVIESNAGCDNQQNTTNIGATRITNLPSVMQISGGTMDMASRSFALPQRKTGLGLLDESNRSQHLSTIRVKETTPRQQFKNLPGISNTNHASESLSHSNQTPLPSSLTTSKATLLNGSKTMTTKTQTRKLDSIPAFQTTLHNHPFQGNSAYCSLQNSTVIRPTLSYSNVLAATDAKSTHIQPSNVTKGKGEAATPTGSSYGVREQQKTTNITSTGNRINIMKAKAAQLTPFQLYQHQQQMQPQTQQRVNHASSSTFQPRKTQNQQQQYGSSSGGGGAVADSGQVRAGGGSGGVSSQQQQNQILLQSTINSQTKQQQQQQQQQPQPQKNKQVRHQPQRTYVPRLPQRQVGNVFQTGGGGRGSSASGKQNLVGSASKSNIMGRTLPPGKSSVKQNNRGQIIGGFQIQQYGAKVGAHMKQRQQQQQHQLTALQALNNNNLGQTQPPTWIRTADYATAAIAHGTDRATVVSLNSTSANMPPKLAMMTSKTHSRQTLVERKPKRKTTNI